MAPKWVSAVGLFLGVCAAAQAKTFTVTVTDDTADGQCNAHCSLREAVQAANARRGRDVIKLKHETYVLSIPNVGVDDEDANATGDLDIRDKVEIRGRTGGSTLDANQLDRVFEVLAGAGKVHLIDLTITNGSAVEAGGGILNSATLRLKRAHVIDNRTRGGELGLGGGIFNSGDLAIELSEITSNLAVDQSLLLGRGGGIYNTADAVLRLTDVAVVGNAAGAEEETNFGGGLFNLGEAWIERSLFTQNNIGRGRGSAIANVEGATLNLVNTTLSDNICFRNGLFALANGGGGFAAGTANLTNVTIADNQGGGLFNGGTADVLNTIVAGNFTVNDDGDVFFDSPANCTNDGTLNHAAFLVGNAGNCPADITVDNATVLDELLFPLADNGGPTLTHALRAGPPTAIDAGVNEGCPGEDQRDKPRPLDGDGDGDKVCDIGAFEHSEDD